MINSFSLGARIFVFAQPGEVNAVRSVQESEIARGEHRALCTTQGRSAPWWTVPGPALRKGAAASLSTTFSYQPLPV